MHRSAKSNLIAAVALLASLAGAGLLSTNIAASAGRHELGYADRVSDTDPPEVALGIAMGAFRGIFVNFLWIRASSLKEEGLFHESVELARAITKLQPRFPRVWAFHAWNLAYNLSVETQTRDERYDWVMAGVRLLREEGIPANPNDLLLHKELAWIFLHKVGGYTDDANRYYKRRTAAEWTVVMGEPPAPETGVEARGEIVDRYIGEWLRPIADAPETLEELVAVSPAVRPLLGRLDTEAGLEPDDPDFLSRYTTAGHTARSIRRAAIEEQLRADDRALLAILEDPAHADAWPALVAHVRQRTLVDQYNMNPVSMIEYTRQHGPLDWRLPAAHSLYWAQRGIDRAVGRLEDFNEENFDFTNTYRLVMQSLQELFRYGDLSFNYIDFVTLGEGSYRAVTNPYFADSYGAIREDVARRSGIFESADRPWTVYNAGYENFMTDVILFFYRRGQLDVAERWRTELINNPGANVHNVEARQRELSLPLDEFVRYNLYDRLDSPHVATSQITAALDGSYAALARGNTELHEEQFNFARLHHQLFLNRQIIDVAAAGGAGSARMEPVDRDFNLLAGFRFADFVSTLDLDTAETLYNTAPVGLQRFAYDIIRARFAQAVDQVAQAGGPSLEVLFPEPEDMDDFRRRVEALLRDRAQGGVEGTRRQ